MLEQQAVSHVSYDFNICVEFKKAESPAALSTVRKKWVSETNAMITIVNICYLEFINFSLGASGVIRQNLQNNGTVSLNVFFKSLK